MRDEIDRYLKPSVGQRFAAALSSAVHVLALIVATTALVAAIVALAWMGYYLQGRAMGAGARDAMESSK